MVARRSDAPRSPAEKSREHSARIDDLARAAGRPTPMLRNEAGHVLELTAKSANPLLVSSGLTDTIDSALKFQSGGLEVRDPTNSEFRDFGARGGYFRGVVRTEDNINCDGSIGATNNIVAGNGLLGGYCTTEGNITALGSTVTGAFLKSTGNAVIDGQLNAGGSIGAGNNLVAANVVIDGQGNVRVAPACERRLKRHVRDLDDPLATVEQWRPAVSTWADDTIRAQRGDEPFAAVYVDEVADTAPEVVCDRGDGTRTTDDRGLIAYLVGSVQQLAADNRALAARVAELESAR